MPDDSSDSFKASQSSHAQQIKIERALQDTFGISQGEARLRLNSFYQRTNSQQPSSKKDFIGPPAPEKKSSPVVIPARHLPAALQRFKDPNDDSGIPNSLEFDLGLDGSGNLTWMVSAAELFGSYDRSNGISISQMNNAFTINTTADDFLFIEVALSTSGDFPTVTSATIKSAGSSSLPGSTNLEYVNTGGSAVSNSNTIVRGTIARYDSTAGCVRRCMSGSMWLLCILTDAQLSGGGTPAKVVCAVILGGGP